MALSLDQKIIVVFIVLLNQVFLVKPFRHSEEWTLNVEIARPSRITAVTCGNI